MIFVLTRSFKNIDANISEKKGLVDERGIAMEASIKDKPLKNINPPIPSDSIPATAINIISLLLSLFNLRDSPDIKISTNRKGRTNNLLRKVTKIGLTSPSLRTIFRKISPAPQVKAAIIGDNSSVSCILLEGLALSSVF
jgi:hypothetical protein